jgi:FKBP-type peptidyl-prolyl cis-trans isomerase
MKLKQAVFLAMGLLPLGVIAQPTPPTGAPPTRPPGAMSPPMMMKPPTAEMPEKGKLSYAIGMYFANNITSSVKRGQIDIDTNIVLKAITDVVLGKPTEMTETEQREVINQLKMAMRAKERAREEEARAKSEAFMAQFAKAPGVITLPNGLEYKVIKEGSGEHPKESDIVTVAYRGTLSDGTEFDHNDNFRTPIKGRVITGWQKILPLMQVGSKWEVAIPSNMAYGPRGKPPTIPGNSVLIFDLELKAVTPEAPAPHAAAAEAPQAGSPVVSGQIIKVPSADELKKGAKIEVINSGQTNAAAQ